VGRDKVDKTVSESDEVKVEKCGACNKEVVKDGIECEVCERWFHCKCEKVAAGTYKALEQDKALHWYCSGCSRGVVNTWKRLQEKQEFLEKEVGQLKEELKGMKILTGRVGQMEKEFNADRAEFKKLDGRMKKIESAVKEGEQKKEQLVQKEIKELKQSFVDIVNEQEEERKKEDNKKTADRDKTVDRELQQKMLEVMEREKRKSNLIFMGIKEATEEEENRIIKDIMDTLVEETDISYEIFGRVGRKDTGNTDKARPLRIVIEDIGHRRLVLSRGKKLKESSYKKVFIVPDLTRLQQEEDKKLRDKLKEIRQQGTTNAKIVKGEIVSVEEGEKVVLFTLKK